MGHVPRQIQQRGAISSGCARAAATAARSANQGQGLAADSAGNAIVTGHFVGTAAFPSPALTATLASVGGWDIFGGEVRRQR
jgi:hypothetical protein